MKTCESRGVERFSFPTCGEFYYAAVMFAFSLSALIVFFFDSPTHAEMMRSALWLQLIVGGFFFLLMVALIVGSLVLTFKHYDCPGHSREVKKMKGYRTKARKVHFNTTDAPRSFLPACGSANNNSQFTTRRSDVTCALCKKSRAWKGLNHESKK